MTSRERVASVINAHLRPVSGRCKLSEFAAQRMQFVQEWFDYRARNHGAAVMTLGHIRSAIKLALDEASALGYGVAKPSKFGLRVPQIVKKSEREVLTLEEISTLIRGSLRPSR